jgi:hypothetical protein
VRIMLVDIAQTSTLGCPTAHGSSVADAFLYHPTDLIRGCLLPPARR